MKTDKITNHSYAIHTDDGHVFILSNRLDHSLNSFASWGRGGNWETLPHSVGPAKVVPYGPSNDLPTFIRDVVSDNNLVPGVIARQMGLLWGQGPQLYSLDFTDGNITKVWTEDKEIMNWLKSWNFEEYLRACTTDYLHLSGFFNSVHLTKGSRIGAKKIAHLEHIPAKNARLGWTDTKDIRDVKEIFVGNFEMRCMDTGVTKYPVYDPSDPGKYPVSAAYNHLYSFSRDFYSLPQFWGALKWIIRGSEIPSIFKYVTENSINLAYHIHSPEAYWDMRRRMLRTLHEDWTEQEIEVEIGKLTVKLLKKMTEALSGKTNAGKAFHTIDVVDDTGATREWKVEAVDQKTKDFIEGQLKISEASTSAITSGMGLHPSLSNIMVNGKLASGSELLYAFKLYLNSDVEIPSSIILRPINQAIAFNFPNKDLQIGFYHQSVKSEESLTSSARIKNN